MASTFAQIFKGTRQRPFVGCVSLLKVHGRIGVSICEGRKCGTDWRGTLS